jgi:hypothetical protein
VLVTAVRGGATHGRLIVDGSWTSKLARHHSLLRQIGTSDHLPGHVRTADEEVLGATLITYEMI